MNKIILYSSLFLFIACNNPMYNEYRHEIESSIELFSDSSYFSDIRCMQYFKDTIYVLDVKRKEVVSFDENFENTRIIGKAGSGPEELNMPVSFYVAEDSVFILDFAAGGIKSFNQNMLKNFIRLIDAKEKRFFYYNQQFFIPCLYRNATILVLSNNCTEQFYGEAIPFTTESETFVRNERNLLNGKEYFYSVSDNIPVIEIYDREGITKISEFDISEIPIIKKNLSFIYSKRKEQNSYYTYIEDCYISDNSIYLLCANLGDRYSVNTIVELSTYPEIKFVATHILPGRIYDSFCVSKDYIYAFNQGSCIIEKIKVSNNE